MKIRLIIIISLTCSMAIAQDERGRARDFGIEPGILTPGQYNAITDVKGVKVGHTTLIEGGDVRTGVTVILPHSNNIFQNKVPAAVYVGNGFGKAIGFTQIQELGNIETPIALTNTLNAWKVANALVDYTLSIAENKDVGSVNVVVGETNDGWLNDIQGRHVEAPDVLAAINAAKTGQVEEGNVGAGTGTRCLGYKGGIGTSSRVLPKEKGGYTLGVIVQSNFGGILTINGAPVGEELGNHYMKNDVPYDVDGSCMIVVATDAPLSDRNLERLAKRAFMALARVGGFAANGSGDYVIAFSTDPNLRIQYQTNKTLEVKAELRNDEMSPLFLAAVEATEEAIYNSLFMAETITGKDGRIQEALPIFKTLNILDSYKAREKK